MKRPAVLPATRREGRAPSGRDVALTAALVVFGLSACSVGPDYKRPELDIAPAWVESDGGGATATEQEWWASFGDPVLAKLVERARTGAPRMREAIARLREARALRSGQKGRFFPSIGSEADYSNSRVSEHGFLEGLGSGSNADSGGVGAVFPGQQIDLFQVGFDAQWEIDVFGHVRRAVEAAGAEVEAAEAAAADVARSLAAETAREVVEVRSFDERLAIADRNIATQKETLDILQQQQRAGVASLADVARGDGQLAAVQSQVPMLRARRAASVHRLEALLAVRSGSLDAELGAGRGVPMPAMLPAAGVPADTLLHRPDVARAERELAAATARIGVARAELFPRFSLNGTFGMQSQSADNLLTTDSRFWYVGPGLRWPIFDAGRLCNAVKAADARTEQAAARYEIAVRGALADVEIAMSAFTQERERQQFLDRCAGDEQMAAAAQRDLYRSGLTDLLHVLDAERARYRAEEELAVSRAAVAEDAIALYKALGGGWKGASRPES